MSNSEPAAFERMTEVAADPSLDVLMDRVEGETTKEQRLALIRAARDERASWGAGR